MVAVYHIRVILGSASDHRKEPAMARLRLFRRRDLFGTLKLALLPAVLAVAACDPAAFGTSGGSTGKVQVALLVPTGASDSQVAGLANSLTRAANLAVSELDSPLIELRTYSTAGDAAVAAASAQQAINEGADVILGPLYAHTAAAVGRAVAGTGTAVMAFSNNTEVAGGNVFVMGNTFENIANQLGSYASRKGKTKVMILNARTPSEEFARDAITRGLAGTGVQVVGSAAFDFSQEGLVAALPGIATQARNLGADALFLTSDTQGALPTVTNLLPDHGLGPDAIQYIGLSRWDRPPSATTLPGLQGGWFAFPDASASAEFNQRFIAATGSAPFPLASLAFDGINAIAVQAKKAGAAGVSPQALVRAGSFAGVEGTFRFMSDGTVRRGMSVATIQNNSLVILQQAPTRLGATGS